MSVNAFLDTSIFVYSFERKAPAKCKQARTLIKESLCAGTGIISWQVVQEFINVASRKFATALSWSELRGYYLKVLKPLCLVQSSADLTLQALALASEYKFSFYDCLIIAAAQRAGCRILYSEDLQHGQKISGLTIVDPFRRTKRTRLV